ncbi:MAG: hypothetical protein D6751_02430 [Deltaproteobacteria bacterium]|nr:MAG: hypothetical protein D6751_02430 [Deltaproteobacteria bacterium]
MKFLRNLVVALMLVGLCWGCTQRDAATVGAMIGRGLAMPIGTAAVIVDETAQSTGDIVRQNPRYDQLKNQPAFRRQTAAAPPVVPPRSRHGEYHPAGAAYPGREDRYHYYRAEVLVKTRGPADIQSIDFAESEDVTRFWN